MIYCDDSELRKDEKRLHVVDGMLQSVRASRVLSLLSVPCCTSTQRRTIKSKHTRISPDKPTPWPYRDYGFSKIAMIYDGTLKRIDENSRIIIIEGNIGSGKVR